VPFVSAYHSWVPAFMVRWGVCLTAKPRSIAETADGVQSYALKSVSPLRGTVPTGQSVYKSLVGDFYRRQPHVCSYRMAIYRASKKMQSWIGTSGFVRTRHAQKQQFI